MSWMRKLLTKPLWYWERALAHALTRCPRLAPTSTSVRPAQPPLVVLTTRKTLANALWSAVSLIHYTQGTLDLKLVLDAEGWPAQAIEEARRLFPSAELLTTFEMVERIPIESPHTRQLARQHPMGRKLATLFALNQTSPLLFSDDDVLAFRPLDEIIAWASAGGGGPPLYLQEAATQHDPGLKARAQRLGLKMAERINVGLLALPCGQLKWTVLEAMLATPATPTASHEATSPLRLSWFPDTTALACQLAEGLGLPADTYVVNCARQFYYQPDVDYAKIKLRHFVGPVRHLLRLKGIPAFLQSCDLKPS